MFNVAITGNSFAFSTRSMPSAWMLDVPELGADCSFVVEEGSYRSGQASIPATVVGLMQAEAHQLVNALLSGFYGCKLGLLRGYIVPSDNNVAYATAHANAFDPAGIRELAEHVKQKHNRGRS